MVFLAEPAPDISGSYFADVHSRFSCEPWRHLQPTRARGSAESLETDSDALVCSPIGFSSFPVCKAVACQWSRASAAKVVHLRCYASGYRPHPHFHHIRTNRLSVARVGRIRTRSGWSHRHSYLHGDSYLTLQALRDRPNYQPHAGLWSAHGYSSFGLLWQRNCLTVPLQPADRPGQHSSYRRLHSSDGCSL